VPRAMTSRACCACCAVRGQVLVVPGSSDGGAAATPALLFATNTARLASVRHTASGKRDLVTTMTHLQACGHCCCCCAFAVGYASVGVLVKRDLLRGPMYKGGAALAALEQVRHFVSRVCFGSFLGHSTSHAPLTVPLSV
jgi:hypothetical protein